MINSEFDIQIPDDEAVIAALALEPHIEGGFYRRTFQSDHHAMVEINGGQRHLMTSIYYLLTKDSPIGHFHLNQSDIVHYFHMGNPIQYSLIFPDGTLNTVVMGRDIIAGAMFAAACTWRRLESFAAYEWFGEIRFDQ